MFLSIYSFSKKLLLFLAIVVCAFSGRAQDTIQHAMYSRDSITQAPTHVFQPNPKKAGLYSAIFPGLGQIYNRQYWKLPIIYGGIAIAGYFFFDNLNKYQDYRLAYIGRINNPYPSDKYVKLYSTAQLQQLQNDYNKYLDMTVLLSTIGYSMQILDAITSAHLKNFDMSRNIAVHLRPVILPGGLGICATFYNK